MHINVFKASIASALTFNRLRLLGPIIASPINVLNNQKEAYVIGLHNIGVHDKGGTIFSLCHSSIVYILSSWNDAIDRNIVQ